MLWRRGVDVNLRGMSKYHIDVDVKEDGGGGRGGGLQGYMERLGPTLERIVGGLYAV